MRLLTMRRDAIFFLVVAAVCLLGAQLQEGVSLFMRNLLVAGMLAAAVVAVALTATPRGSVPSGLPMVGFGVLLLVLGPFAARWVYGDDFVSALRLEHPLRMARMIVHSGYALTLAGVLLLAYRAARTSAAHKPETDAVPISRQEPRERSLLQEAVRSYLFDVKVFFVVGLVLLIVVFGAISLGIF